MLQDWCQIYVLNQLLFIIISGSFIQPSVKIDITIICQSKGSLLWTVNEWERHKTGHLSSQGNWAMGNLLLMGIDRPQPTCRMIQVLWDAVPKINHNFSNRYMSQVLKLEIAFAHRRPFQEQLFFMETRYFVHFE